MQKIFFIDIDDTLLPTGNEGISKENLKAVKKLNKEHDVYIATGKSYYMAQDLLKDLNINKSITSNGSYVKENDLITYSKPIVKEDINIVKEIINNYDNVFLGGQGNNGSYILVPEKGTYNEYIKQIFANLSVTIPQAVEDFDEDIYQLWLLGDIESVDFNHDKFDTFKWHKNGLDIVYKNTSKAQGIRHLLNTKYKDKSVKTYAFGDSLNDIAMFELVDESIAMSNGHKDLIAKAKHISDNASNKGISNYLLKNNIIK